MSFARRRAVLMFVAAAMLAATFSRGQDAALPPPPPIPGAGAPGSDGADVYLNDSFEVRDALTRAEEFASAGRWRDAARMVQEAADRFAGGLVRVEPGSFVGARRHIAGVVSRWPAEGLEVWRDLYEDELARLASSCSPRDYQKRLELFERYYCARGALALADSIARHALEDGDFALAGYVYERALDGHPDAPSVRDEFEAGLAVVRAIERRRVSRRADVSGRPSAAAAIRPETKGATAASGPKVRWKGHDRPLADVLADIELTFGDGESAPGEQRDWPMFGGDPSRNRTPALNIDELGLLWRWTYDELTGGERKPVEARNDDPTDDEETAAGDPVVQPVAAGGFVLAQVGASVVALHRASGEIAWQFQLDGAPTGRDAMDAYPAGWDAVTVAGGRVYASLPNVHAVAAGGGATLRTHELVCLDLRDGRLLWRFDGGAGVARFAELHFDTGPLVSGYRVLVVGRRTRSFGFEDSYLYSVKAVSGELESVVHLGSASTGGFGTHAVTRGVVTGDGAFAYVSNNLGTVAALSPHAGDVKWLRTYRRHRGENGDVGSRFSRRVGSWQLNPAFLAGNEIAILPTDASSLVFLDALDGRVLGAAVVEESTGLEMALGFRGGIVCGAGREAACIKASTGERTWSSPLPDNGAIAGRGVWTRDRLWIPTKQSLVGFDPGGGATVSLAWDAEGEGGNLLALDDQLVVAGVRTLSAYVRKSEVWRALRERLAASPADPVPALELAEVALRSGDRDEALASLAEAARREASRSGAIDTTVSSRLFRDAVTFAAVLHERDKLNEAALDRLFDLAERHAVETSDHAAYRFRFGDLYQRFGRADRAVLLFQQVLSDRSLRDLPMPGPDASGASRAGTEAQARVAELMERVGPQAYAPFEAEARRLLEAARTSADADALTRVVESYPNSSAAPAALTELGELAAERRRPGEAARFLVQAYQRYPRQVDQPRLMKRIASAYEAAGRRDVAYLWLTKASREFPSWTFEAGGGSSTLKELLDTFADARDRVEPRRPDVAPPLPTRYTRAFDEGSSMMAPRFADDPAHRWGVLFVSTPDGIRAVHPRDGRDLWTEPLRHPSIGELLYATDERAVFATPFDLLAVSIQDGRELWRVGPGGDADAKLAGDWEGGQTFRRHLLRADRIVSVRENGVMTSVDARTGQTLWTRPHKLPLGPMNASDHWIVFHIAHQGAAAICVVDAATGDLIDMIPTSERRPIEELFVTLDDQVVVVTSRSFAAFDVASRRPRWEFALSGQLRRSSLLLDLDAVYFSTDGGDLLKVSLDDGRLLWQTDRVLVRDAPELRVGRAGSSIAVVAGAAVSALDPLNGLLLWRGTTPPRPKLRFGALLRDHVVALDVAERQPEEGASLFFYDHRAASGIIPEGGVVRLGALDDVRAMQALDGAVVIQAGTTLHGFAQDQRSP